MTRTVEGILRQIDWDRREAVIGGERFDLWPGLPVSADLVPGTGVVASVVMRGSGHRLVHLQPRAEAR